VRIKAQKLTAVAALAAALMGAGALGAQALVVDAEKETSFLAGETMKVEDFLSLETGKAETLVDGETDDIVALVAKVVDAAVPTTPQKVIELVQALDEDLLLEDVTELVNAILGGDLDLIANLSAGLN